MAKDIAKPPRRQPKQDRARNSVEIILEAAARVLRERGYAAATTNRIAAAGGVSVGTVYEYFENKDAVFEALIEREIGALVLAFQDQDLARRAPIAEVLGGLITAGMRTMGHGPELFRALEAVPGSSFRRHLAGARASVIALVEGVLQAHRDELRVTDLELASFVIVSAIEGVAANATTSVFDERLARELTALSSLYLTGSVTSEGGS